MSKSITALSISLVFVSTLLSQGCTSTETYNINPIPTGAIERAAYDQDIKRCETAAQESPAPEPKLIPSRTSVNFGLGVGIGSGHHSGGFGGVGIQHQVTRTTTEQEERHALVVECLQAKGYNSSL